MMRRTPPLAQATLRTFAARRQLSGASDPLRNGRRPHDGRRRRRVAPTQRRPREPCTLRAGDDSRREWRFGEQQRRTHPRARHRDDVRARSVARRRTGLLDRCHPAPDEPALPLSAPGRTGAADVADRHGRLGPRSRRLLTTGAPVFERMAGFTPWPHGSCAVSKHDARAPARMRGESGPVTSVAGRIGAVAFSVAALLGLFLDVVGTAKRPGIHSTREGYRGILLALHQLRGSGTPRSGCSSSPGSGPARPPHQRAPWCLDQLLAYTAWKRSTHARGRWRSYRGPALSC